MSHDVECTHCHVLMTSWSAPGSPVRYWQCPFCSRTHSSLYSEVFERGAGARRIEPALEPQPAGPPQATAEDIQWARLKVRAAHWFARLEQERLPSQARAPASATEHAVPAQLRSAAGGRRTR